MTFGLSVFLSIIPRVGYLLWMDNDHGLCDGPMFTIGRSSKSQPWC